MIDIINICKSYGKHQVLKDINLKLRKGSINALLGHNGSGKTTLIKIILNLVKPDSGDVLYEEKSILNQWEYRNKIGYMAQIANFPDNLSAIALFNLITKLRKQTATKIDELIELLKLGNDLNKPLTNLSGGTKQKANAVMALMFDSPLLILDEPTAGLDPVASRALKKILLAEKENGKTIILTSHILADIEQLADSVTVLNDGNLVFSGNIIELTNRGNLEKAIAGLFNNFSNNHGAKVVC